MLKQDGLKSFQTLFVITYFKKLYLNYQLHQLISPQQTIATLYKNSLIKSSVVANNQTVDFRITNTLYLIKKHGNVFARYFCVRGYCSDNAMFATKQNFILAGRILSEKLKLKT